MESDHQGRIRPIDMSKISSIGRECPKCAGDVHYQVEWKGMNPHPKGDRNGEA